MNLITTNDLDRLATAAMRRQGEGLEEYFACAWLRAFCDDWQAPAWYPMHAFLFLVARHLAPQVMVELGGEVGRGMCSLYLGCHEADVVGVDTGESEHVRGVLTANAQSSGSLSSGVWSLHRCYSRDFARQNAALRIGLLHVDSEHTYETTDLEYRLYRPMMERGGVMLFDDALTLPVRRAIDENFDGTRDQIYWHEALHPGQGYAAVICG
ncbi:MAG: class I SAM-dependent methyltransferase [Nitrospinae bacterium]|nr:class I SAM-dependent methyltransferase [Nitrospinota bacterium]